MNPLKNKSLPIIGMLILVSVIIYSYTNNYIYLDKLFVSGVILSVIFFIRIQENFSTRESSNDQFDQIQENE